MARGEAHRVPLIVGSNAAEASLFVRFMDYLPTNEPVIENFLAAAEPGVGQRLRAAYPGYPNPAACLAFGSDFTFGATHASELLAVFDVYDTRLGALLTVAGDRRSARRVSRDVQRRWRSFSRSGVPGDDWPRYTTAQRAT
jgi:para-nitrobenzyl esterase